jgi:phosphate transport system protein
VVLSVTTELERVGDYASNIAGRIIDVQRCDDLVPPPAAINDMATLAKQMLHKSLDALLKQDTDLARSLEKDDDEVDALRTTLRGQLVERAQTEPQHLELIVALLDVVHVLERVADRATNIGERVIYLVHSTIEELNP